MYMLINNYNNMRQKSRNSKQGIQNLDRSSADAPQSYQRNEGHYQSLNDVENEISPSQDINEGGSNDESDQSPCMNEDQADKKEKGMYFHKQNKPLKKKSSRRQRSKKKKTKHDKILNRQLTKMHDNKNQQTPQSNIPDNDLSRSRNRNVSTISIQNNKNMKYSFKDMSYSIF